MQRMPGLLLRIFMGLQRGFKNRNMDITEQLDLLRGESFLNQRVLHGGNFFRTYIFNQNRELFFNFFNIFSGMSRLNNFVVPRNVDKNSRNSL
jgi:hypothetical protein